MKNITISLSPTQAVFLWRLFNCTDKSKQELLATKQGVYAIKGDPASPCGDAVTPLPRNEFYTDKLWDVFDNALNNAKINAKTFKVQELIVIDGHEVEFLDGKIKVGCQTIDNGTIAKIAKIQNLI